MTEVESMAAAEERRKRQRFVAKWRGEYCFWVVVNGDRKPLVDLSLEGFAMPATSPPSSSSDFEFVLQRINVPDEIRGRARVVNYLSAPEGGQAGCRFESFDGDGQARLRDWLTTHVIMNATVRISEKDALKIVEGRSLV